MKLAFFPKTRLGKWSLRSATVFLTLFVFSLVMVGLSQRQEGEEFMMKPAVRFFLIVEGLLAMVSGLAAFFLGIVSIVKHKERSVLIYLGTFVGLLALLFLLGEFLFPH